MCEMLKTSKESRSDLLSGVSLLFNAGFHKQKFHKPTYVMQNLSQAVPCDCNLDSKPHTQLFIYLGHIILNLTHKTIDQIPITIKTW